MPVVTLNWNLRLVGNPTDSYSTALESKLSPNFAVLGAFGWEKASKGPNKFTVPLLHAKSLQVRTVQCDLVFGF